MLVIYGWFHNPLPYSAFVTIGRNLALMIYVLLGGSNNDQNIS
jgi:hypothetical protein